MVISMLHVRTHTQPLAISCFVKSAITPNESDIFQESSFAESAWPRRTLTYGHIVDKEPHTMAALLWCKGQPLDRPAVDYDTRKHSPLELAHFMWL